MEYKDIISITNMSGLFRLIGTKSDGAIVEGLEDNTKKFLSSRKYNFTPLDSIEVYTTGENISLKDIFIAMKPKDAEVIAFDFKSASKDELYKFITSIYPTLDTDRVYPSDIKKMIKWFGILKSKDLLEFKAKEENTPAAEEATEALAEKPKKAAKKAAPKAEATEGAEEAAPKKKAAPKKAAAKSSDDASAEAPKKKAAPKKSAKKED